MDIFLFRYCPIFYDIVCSCPILVLRVKSPLELGQEIHLYIQKVSKQHILHEIERRLTIQVLLKTFQYQVLSDIVNIVQQYHNIVLHYWIKIKLLKNSVSHYPKKFLKSTIFMQFIIINQFYMIHPRHVQILLENVYNCKILIDFKNL